MRKVTIIFGTRPEAIKLCPLVLSLRKKTDFLVEVCNTGQHRSMIDQVLRVFGVAPDVDLNLMQHDQTLAGLTSKAIVAIDGYLSVSRPDLVIVQGDTTSTLCGALAAFYHKIPVGHVEAGLRTHNRYSPFPEEINRTLVSRIARYHFAPTSIARDNLLAEGIAPENIFVTGNTVIDALQYAVAIIKHAPPVIPGLPADLSGGNGASPPFVLITGHRRENFGSGFENICRSIMELAQRFPDIHFVYPVHLNPNVRTPVFRMLSGCGNIHLIEPLEYLPFVSLMMRCILILTDSGGIQEEAPSLGKPVVFMRETTERPEAVEAGAVLLVGAQRDKIVDAVSRLLTDRDMYAKMARAINPYGDGKACERIVKVVNKKILKED